MWINTDSWPEERAATSTRDEPDHSPILDSPGLVHDWPSVRGLAIKSKARSAADADVLWHPVLDLLLPLSLASMSLSPLPILAWLLSVPLPGHALDPSTAEGDTTTAEKDDENNSGRIIAATGTDGHW